MNDETIAAIATAPGRGGVAVIRVSGPEAFAVAERIAGPVPAPGHFRLTTFRQPISAVPSSIKQSADNQTIKQSADNQTIKQSKQSNNQTILDTGLLLSFKGPHSYTGEDVVEFQCHGGTVTPRRVLEACLSAGARLARRGEFTERAFLNGRLDYDQAESVLDLIDAKTARAADAALEGLAGRKARALRELYERLLALSSEVEHALDIDEGELDLDAFGSRLEAQTAALAGEIEATLVRLREGRMLRAGALVVLAGAPNAGKSSLMNALLEDERVLVSERAGTTRDSIEEGLDLDGWPVRLVDTAGLRSAAEDGAIDPVEVAGIRRAEELIAKADVVVRLMPAGGEGASSRGPYTMGEGSSSRGRRTMEEGASSRGPCTLGGRADELVVVSKCDLLEQKCPPPGSGGGAGALSQGTCTSGALSQGPHTSHLRLSAKTGEGLAELKRAIVARLEAKAAQGAEAGESGDRAVAVLTRVRALLPRTFEDPVLYANALARAAETLGEVLGARYSDDLLTALFTRFCVGK